MLKFSFSSLPSSILRQTNLKGVARSLRRPMSSSSNSSRPFEKILIANRGEIACRIIRTAKRLGVKTVAVYSEVDARAQHVKMADEAYFIGSAASSDSYLRMDRVLEAAVRSGAQAIHPGYGFLSENARFVDMVEAAGITFIGPSSGPMHAMGDKINSKKIAKEAGCFTIPGFEGEVENEESAVKLGEQVGYPVMIKASAGGGGKGMRVAYNEAELREGFRLSKAEAMSSFGDDRMLIERFIEDPHHIEIQVIADNYGNVVAFPERECSVQRRNQKVVEESPSCLLTPETRKAMQQQAIALCKATKYRSAGTVEMLCDGKQNFYFLEMNTRLQVEHPITELVSGEDLVEHMLWIAAGKKIPARLLGDPLLNPKGWAIESRVYAEDPHRNFLPSIGPLTTYNEPPTFSSGGKTCRIDTGVYEGGLISMYYDPMISKLVTHASTRGEAIALMETALDQYVVTGLGNNITFLRSVMRNEKFRIGDYNTKFIAEQYPTPKGFTGVELNQRETLRLVAAASAIQLDRAQRNSSASKNVQSHSALPGPHHANAQAQAALAAQEAQTQDFNDEYIVLLGGRGTRANPSPTFYVRLSMEEETLDVHITPLPKGLHRKEEIMELVGEDDSKMHHHRRSLPKEVVSLGRLDWMDGMPIATISYVEGKKPEDEDGSEHDGCEEDAQRGEERKSEDVYVQYEGRTSEGYNLRLYGSQQEVIVRSLLEHHLSEYMLDPEVKDFSRFLLCPMPGTLISCSVIAGQKVVAGEQLAVVEAMKMQNVLRAAKSGTVKSVSCKAGDHLKVDQIILEFEE